MIIKFIILYVAVVAITFMAIFCIDFGQYKSICDTAIAIIWFISYLLIISKSTIGLLKLNSSNVKICKNTFLISSFVALFFWVVIVNAEINHFRVFGSVQLVYLSLSLIIYILLTFGIGMIASVITRSYYNKIHTKAPNDHGGGGT